MSTPSSPKATAAPSSPHSISGSPVANIPSLTLPSQSVVHSALSAPGQSQSSNSGVVMAADEKDKEDKETTPAAAKTTEEMKEFLPKNANDFFQHVGKPLFDEIGQDFFQTGHSRRKKKDFMNSVRAAIRDGDVSADESKIRGALGNVLKFGQHVKAEHN